MISDFGFRISDFSHIQSVSGCNSFLDAQIVPLGAPGGQQPGNPKSEIRNPKFSQVSPR